MLHATTSPRSRRASRPSAFHLVASVPGALALSAFGAFGAGCAATGGVGADAATAPSGQRAANVGSQLADERAPSAAGATPPLTLAEIFADRQWVARSPQDATWTADGRFVCFDREREGSDVRDRYRLDVNSGAVTELADDELGPASAPGEWTFAPAGGPVSLARERTPSRRRAFKVHAGNLFLWSDGQIHQLTRARHAVSSARWSSDGSGVYVKRDGSWWHLPLDAAGGAHEIVRLQAGEAPADEPERPEGFRARAQERLIGAVAEERRRDQQERDVERRRRALDGTRAPEPFHVGEGHEVWRDSLHPDGHVLVALIEPTGQGDGPRDTLPVWLTDDADIETERVRPHVGDAARLVHRLEWFDLENRARVEVPLDRASGQGDDPLAFLRVSNGASARGGVAGGGSSAPAAPEGPRGVRGRLFDWSPDGRHLALQLYSLDEKDRWICLLDADDATLTEIHRLHDEAWIGGFNEMGWLPGTSKLWFQSEESGWAHLYLFDVDAGTTRALTSGPWEADDVVAAPDGSALFFVGNREDHGVFEVYRVPTDGGAVQRITDFGGVTSFELSPDGSQLVCTVSRALEPPELYVQDAVAGATAVRRTFTIEEDWARRPWVEPEYVAVPGRDGHAIPARLYRPAGAARAPRPAVLFVHGAGYLQNAHRGWSSYAYEFMFHSFLVQQGFVVLDMDYRASAGYGRDWRTAIWRNMGAPELEDLVDGAAWLVDELHVDPERIGVYGGSYGGFLTLMALFKQPDVFACGAALRPVTDWSHYSDPYTARILHTPDLDPAAYRRSSPIEYAEGLADPLLICHGLVDSNVLAKDSVRLTQRLIELGKQDFETMLYPAEGHGFRWPSSWLDEYRRIWKLFDTWLAEPIGARAAGGAR